MAGDIVFSGGDRFGGGATFGPNVHFGPGTVFDGTEVFSKVPSLRRRAPLQSAMTNQPADSGASWTRSPSASEKARRGFRLHARMRIGFTFGLDRTWSRRTHRHSCKKPGARAPLIHGPAVRACQLCGKQCQSSAGCAPETGSVAGYRMRPASGESCDVSLLLGVCELAAVVSGITSREGGASSGLRSAAFSRWSLLAVRSHFSARALLTAKESAN